MRPNIHPQRTTVAVTCSGCNNQFSLLMAFDKDTMHVEYCNKCHPAYTGIRKIATTGAIEKFANKFKKHSKLTAVKSDTKKD